jgi:hypothetical protein
VSSRLLVYARHDLAAADPACGEPAVLLEGSWPAGATRLRRSLDEVIDRRHQWIDLEADRCAEAAGACQDSRHTLCAVADGTRSVPATIPGGISPAWLDALALRYALVKWIRVLAYFREIRPLERLEAIELVAARRRDEDYADLMDEACRMAGASLRIRWIDRGPAPSPLSPPNGRLRRLAARLAAVLAPKVSPARRRDRVVLCGNPRLLDAVCGEMSARGAGLWWLYDRFALRGWLRWRRAGVGQLCCDSSLGRAGRLRDTTPDRLLCRGVDLAPLVRRWVAERLATHGPRWTRLIEQIDAHFRCLRPTAVLLDEDATPLARAAVAVGRRYGATSWVVQHGAPCCRFGFAPLAADRICAWGPSSADQLVRWGVAPQRIITTGSPWHDGLYHRLAAVRRARADVRGSAARRRLGPCVLLLTTVAPRDERPDAAELALTRAGYAEMLRVALAAVARLPRAMLTVKLHPRTPDDPIVRAALAQSPALDARIVRRGSLGRLLAASDCVLSCLSSAGIDATLAGVPVIQLMPRGAGEILPPAQWGLAGAVRTEEELTRLLGEVLDAGHCRPLHPEPGVFGTFDRPAAAKIADLVLDCAAQDEEGVQRAACRVQGSGPWLPLRPCPGLLPSAFCPLPPEP